MPSWTAVEENPEGLFLVRESPTVDGAFILSVVHQGQPQHYQINRHGTDAFFSIGLFNFSCHYHQLKINI